MYKLIFRAIKTSRPQGAGSDSVQSCHNVITLAYSTWLKFSTFKVAKGGVFNSSIWPEAISQKVLKPGGCKYFVLHERYK